MNVGKNFNFTYIVYIKNQERIDEIVYGANREDVKIGYNYVPIQKKSIEIISQEKVDIVLSVLPEYTTNVQDVKFYQEGTYFRNLIVYNKALTQSEITDLCL